MRRFVLGLVFVVAAVWLLAHAKGSTTPSAEAPAKATPPGASGTFEVAILPTQSPAAQQPDVLSTMNQRARVGKPLKVQFAGHSSAGRLSFDVSTDGRGNASGSYMLNGVRNDIILAGNTVYLHGPGTGWHTVSAHGAGVISTAASSPTLEECIASTETADAAITTGTAVFEGVPVRLIHFAAPEGGIETLAVPLTGPPDLLRWVVPSPLSAAVCNGGEAGSPLGNVNGAFSMTPLAQPPRIKIPTSA